MSLTANENPSSILNYNVKFKTTNPENKEVFIESFNVSGPTPSGSFKMPLNFISLSPSKLVVPLQSNVKPGSYWLKFWFPQPESNVMYITFCQKNPFMADGFYDYKTGVTNDFRSALKLWIKDNAATIPTEGNIYKKLLFTACGLDTNKVSSSIEFKVNFYSNFISNAPVSQPVSVDLDNPQF